MRKSFFFCLFFFTIHFVNALNLVLSSKVEIENYLTSAARKTVYVPDIRLDSVIQEASALKLYANINLSYIRFDSKSVNEIYRNVKSLLPPDLAKFPLQIITDTKPIEFFVASDRSTEDYFANPRVTPIVSNLSKPYLPSRGLYDSHLAIWQSHGLYYSQAAKRWEFQRAMLFQTVEDLFTQSFVLPYLAPMLQNAGAYVFIPRERDIQKSEVIVDNDGSTSQSQYLEENRDDVWTNGADSGFANKQLVYLDGENPFRMGFYRQIPATNNESALSSCEWIPDIPEKGRYAVYISYKSLPNSADGAHYTVFHLGGQTRFSVNQQMGGGTWIFLGFFMFDKGHNNNCKVVLSNYSRNPGKVITADAVKIGGGMGNVARQPLQKPVLATDSIQSQAQQSVPVSQAQLSYYPRFVEGARYWLQWAGVPDSVYSRTKGENDYLDDFQSRGYWVNYLAGGSVVLPNQKGLNVPIDLSFALHSDAGAVPGDSIVGTLGICMTQFNNQLFENGKTRWTSRDLTEYIMDEVVSDIRSGFEPKWTRRQLWNRSYSEARVPNVPTTLLELLAHQNFADMRYGLDPSFQFSVSRAIYRGMLKFVAQQHQREYVVQPLPVTSFYARFVAADSVRLGWQPVNDPLEPTAKPTKYIVYTREEDGDFDDGRIVMSNTITLKIEKDRIYSYKIAALNDGGESFPSEILSVCRKSGEKGTVLIVNGFDRVAAPDSYDLGENAGFADFVDHGVPYINQYNYVGPQTEFMRNAKFQNNTSPGFGASASNYVGKVIAGNTFDYSFVHGKAFRDAGYSFVSSSRDAVVKGQVNMNKYSIVDIILGKQKQTKIGRGAVPVRYKTFDADFQHKISTYCLRGGNVLVSGSFVGTDLWKNGTPQQSDIDFATKILKYKFVASRAAFSGKVIGVEDKAIAIDFQQQLNDKILAIESPDAIDPADSVAESVFKYAENGLGAGVFFKGSYKSCVLGFPIESIETDEQRGKLVSSILSLFEK